MASPEPRKRRRIHMDVASCSEFASSSEGVKPLVAPVTLEKSDKDPNKGLYPKSKSHRLTNSSPNKYASFSRASDVYSNQKRNLPLYHVTETNEMPSNSFSNEHQELYHNCQLRTNVVEPSSKRKKEEIQPQRNKITSYYLKSELPECYLKNSCPESHCVDSHPSRNGDVSLDSYPDESSRQNVNVDTMESLKLVSEIDFGDLENFESDEPDYFGLFGATETEKKVEPDYFNKLPREVMEYIFCQLPFLDLQNCKLVCHLWNDIISSENFIHWKTTYYKLKYGCQFEEETLASILISLSGHSADNCLQALIRFMKEGFSRKPAPDMYDKLKSHRKFLAAESVLKERFPDSSLSLNPWCIIATIVLISEDVKDVSGIIRHLLSNDSHTLLIDVLEVLYCIASFLFYCMNELKVNHGLHYRVYYALYICENHISVGVDTSSIQSIEFLGQQTMHHYCASFRLTCEQNRIVSHHLQPGDIIKVVAFAGSGKTSTLIELARCRPDLKFLNVMFNKSVCDHAQKLFTQNVECRTAHSLAFVSKGRMFAHRISSKFSPDIIREYLQLQSYPFEVLKYCKAVNMTLQSFMSSADMEITMKHTPETKPVSNNERVIEPTVLTSDERLHICQSAIKMWELMSDRNQSCPVTHDVYLKLFQLSKPVISKYNCIMVDEAQDCNPAMLDIILSQKVPIVLVGDPHQQIYGFRGSKNALNDVTSTHTYHLTKSFRFGPEIAYIASCCIEVLKNYTRETLVGCDKPGTVSGVIKGQYAIITRSNAGLFSEAIRLCCQKIFKHEDEPRSIHGAFVGGISSYGLNQIEDIYRLKVLSGKKPHEIKPEDQPRDKFIRKFHSLNSLIAYADKKDDTELSFKIELVLHHNEKIPEYISTLKRKCSTPLELANVVFSTAHKAKGFEFETVRLSDDFNMGRTPGVYDANPKAFEEEHNIMYVALTRAKSSLFLTEKLYSVLLLAQEKFEYPVLSRDVVLDQDSPNCVLCFTPIKPHTALSVIRRRVTLTTGRVLKEGALCTKCAAAPYYRPQVVRDPVIMYLDPIEDYAHRSMKFLVGPLPSDPPLPDEYDNFQDLHAMDLIYVINVGGPA